MFSGHLTGFVASIIASIYPYIESLGVFNTVYVYLYTESDSRVVAKSLYISSCSV